MSVVESGGLPTFLPSPGLERERAAGSGGGGGRGRGGEGGAEVAGPVGWQGCGGQSVGSVGRVEGGGGL